MRSKRENPILICLTGPICSGAVPNGVSMAVFQYILLDESKKALCGLEADSNRKYTKCLYSDS